MPRRETGGLKPQAQRSGGGHRKPKAVKDSIEKRVTEKLDLTMNDLGHVDIYRSRMTVAAMAMNALKLVSVLQHRVAAPLYSFSFPKKFPVRRRHLQVSRSNSAGKRRSDPGGMSASILASAGASPGQFASNARSARSLPQDNPSLSAEVPRRSWAWPGSSRTSIRLPSASVSAVILVVTPP